MTDAVHTDHDLLYAEVARCQCGAGLAYPHTTPSDEERPRSWRCSAVLRGTHAPAIAHDDLPFAFWKVREEGSVNGQPGRTTRPPGTAMRSVGRATCPVCQHQWSGEPYDASVTRSHWQSGPCPNCGNDVGATHHGKANEDHRKRIEHRFGHVVIDVQVVAVDASGTREL